MHVKIPKWNVKVAKLQRDRTNSKKQPLYLWYNSEQQESSFLADLGPKKSLFFDLQQCTGLATHLIGKAIYQCSSKYIYHIICTMLPDRLINLMSRPARGYYRLLSVNISLVPILSLPTARQWPPHGADVLLPAAPATLHQSGHPG